MKAILKTLPTELLLKYDEKFISEINSNILRDIIPQLISSMKLRFKPTYKQVRDWLNSCISIVGLVSCMQNVKLLTKITEGCIETIV